MPKFAIIGRTLQAMGHRVRLIPAQYVKPFVKRGKNDRNDAAGAGLTGKDADRSIRRSTEPV